MATVVAREADLEEIGRVVAQEAALLLNASGSAVYRFESEDGATCVAAHPPAAPGRRSTHGDHPDPLHRDRAAPPAPARRPASRTTAGRPIDASVREVLDGRPAQRHRLAAVDAGPALGGPHRRIVARRTPSARPRSGAWRPSPSSRRSPSPTPRRGTSSTACADTDPLTGLANRRALTARLNGEVERARRHGHPLSLAILDLDDFKMVNDTLGHQTGDAVLAEVGRRLTATCRAGELVARMGGEEFAWILPLSDAEASVVAVERARAEIARIDVEGASGITCSAGICDLSVAGDVDALLRRADRALYVAKGAGRDRVEIAR